MESEPIRWIRRWQWWKLYRVKIKLCQQTWGTPGGGKDSLIHTCDFCGDGFDLLFLRGSVRETGKSMFCV
jgi:hypothetical protein